MLDVRTPSREDPRALPTPELVAQIVRRHHKYLRDAFAFLVPLSQKIARVHSAHNQNLLDVRDDVEELAELLLPHLDHEEQTIFPLLLSPQGRQAEIAREAKTMVTESTEVAILLERLRNAAHDYVLPEWACTSYSTLIKELQVLEADLIQHLKLENDVLLPRFQVAK